MINWIKGLFSRGKNQDDFISIIKKLIKSYIEAEKKDEGIVNLIFGVILTFIIIVLVTTSVGFKIITFFKPDFNKPIFNHIEMFVLIVLLFVFFFYCAHMVFKIQRERNSK